MAATIIGNPLGFIDKRQVSKAGVTVPTIGTIANYASLSAMQTRLTAINGSYFTAKKLSQMSYNDTVFALRLADDAASI